MRMTKPAALHHTVNPTTQIPLDFPRFPSTMLSRLSLVASMGFVASAQIPPHTAGCAATTCPMYYSCVEDSKGVASCVPPPPPAGPCAGVHCAPGTECVAIGNQAWCKPLPVGCAATQCRYGRTCYEIAGHALCLPSWWFPSPTPPSPPVVGCDQLKCVNCENDPKTGEGVCLPPPIGCGSLECAHCVEDAKGNGKCVPPPTPPTNPCDLLKCVQCEVQADGTARCVSPDAFPPTPIVGCEAMTCLVGTTCTNDATGQGHCSNPCDLLKCVQCEVQADGTAKCVSPDA